MSDYFRITAYSEGEDFSLIADSHGMFEKLWQFSSFFVKKGFRIVEIGAEGSFDYGDMDKAPENNEMLYLRACGKGMAIRNKNRIGVNGKNYETN